MERPLWEQTFMNMCKDIAKRSLCIKYQTSALIVKGSQIASFGYNGTASKKDECYSYWKKYYDNLQINDKNICITKTRKRKKEQSNNKLTIRLIKKNKIPFDEWIKTQEFKDLHSKWSIIHEMHAEMNALQWISKSDVDDTYSIYTYMSPCEQCAKHILAYGIKTLYYHIEYCGRIKGDIGGIEYLKNNDVKCIQII